MMNCSSFKEYLSLYCDGLLDDEKKAAFESHLNKCARCKNEYINFKTMIVCLHEIEKVELPKNFSIELKNKLLKKEKKSKKLFFMHWKIISSAVAGILIIAVSAVLLQNNLSDGFRMQRNNEALLTEDAVRHSGTAAPQFAEEKADGSTLPKKEMTADDRNAFETVTTYGTGQEGRTIDKAFGRKIIEKGRIHIEVEQFDKVYGRVTAIIENAQGYVQHSEVYYSFLDRERPENSLKNAYMEIRIPNIKFTNVFAQFKELGIVVEENISGQDITETYMDIENQVKNLTVQEERLRDILQNADKVEDLLKIENELNRVRTQINHLTTDLNRYEQLAAMSVINLQISQVRGERIKIQSINENLWNKARNSFIHSVNGIVHLLERGLIKLFAALPALIIMLIAAVFVFYVIYKSKKKGRS